MVFAFNTIYIYFLKFSKSIKICLFNSIQFNSSMIITIIKLFCFICNKLELRTIGFRSAYYEMKSNIRLVLVIFRCDFSINTVIMMIYRYFFAFEKIQQKNEIKQGELPPPSPPIFKIKTHFLLFLRIIFSQALFFGNNFSKFHQQQLLKNENVSHLLVNKHV